MFEVYFKIYYMLLESILEYVQVHVYFWALWRLKNEVPVSNQRIQNRDIEGVSIDTILSGVIHPREIDRLYFHKLGLVQKFPQIIRLSLADFIPTIYSLKSLFRLRYFRRHIYFRSFIAWREDQDSFRALYWNSIISYFIYLCSSSLSLCLA